MVIAVEEVNHVRCTYNTSDCCASLEHLTTLNACGCVCGICRTLSYRHTAMPVLVSI